jgi:site-specific DNA-methyltransferase (adenine-specific)
MITITNECNMELMKRYPDNHFDLAIVDPPYGINGGSDNRKTISKSNNNFNRLKRKGNLGWDNGTPNKEYFDELKRVSKNQIIWGGNYMIDYLESTRCFICWDKMTYIPTMSQMELAWTSFKTHTRYIKINSTQLDRIHISQKPVKLYEWLLMNYAKEGDKILDTHGGSLSIALAVHNVNSLNKMNLSLNVCELDKDYFDSGVKRYENHIKQKNIFDM